MSDFWLGATLGLGIYWSIETAAALILMPHEATINGTTAAINLIMALVAFVIALTLIL